MISNIKHKKRVVIIDDDLQWAESVANQINDSDSYEIYHYADSVESFFENDVPKNFEFLLLDIRLPGVAGVDAISKIKEFCPTAEIIMLTVVEDSDSIFKALRMGASGYIIKSDVKVSIEEHLNVYLENGALLSPSVARKIIQYYQPTQKLKMLKPKEEAILKLMAEGQSYEYAADVLGVSIDIIRYYIKKIYTKLHVNNKVDAVRKYYNLLN
jgi:DNA-binding NarL/FixJ family response regulator